MEDTKYTEISSPLQLLKRADNRHPRTSVDHSSLDMKTERGVSHRFVNCMDGVFDTRGVGMPASAGDWSSDV